MAGYLIADLTLGCHSVYGQNGPWMYALLGWSLALEEVVDKDFPFEEMVAGV
jgi:hypothetical protein